MKKLLLILFCLIPCACSLSDNPLKGEWKAIRTEVYRDGVLAESYEGMGLSEDMAETSITIDRKYLTFHGLEEEMYGVYKYDSENAIMAFMGDFFYYIDTITESALTLSFIETADECVIKYVYYYKRID